LRRSHDRAVTALRRVSDIGRERACMTIYGHDPALVFAAAFVGIVVIAAILTARG